MNFTISICTNMLRAGFEPEKIYRLACETFEGMYDKETIFKWLKTFYWRFFAQQFKRSCLPDDTQGIWKRCGFTEIDPENAK